MGIDILSILYILSIKAYFVNFAIFITLNKQDITCQPSPFLDMHIYQHTSSHDILPIPSFPFGLCHLIIYPICSFQKRKKNFLRCSFTHAMILFNKTFYHFQLPKTKKQVHLPSPLQQGPKLAHISQLPKLQSISDSGQNGLFAVSQTVPILFLMQFTLAGCLLLSDHLPFEILSVLQGSSLIPPVLP